MNDAPCRRCEERHPKCHKDCEKYIEWRRKRDEEYEHYRKQHEVVEYEINRSKKIARWKEEHRV